MKARRIAIFGLATVVLAATSLAAQDSFKLLRSSKVGTTSKYSLEANMSVMGTDAKFSATILEKVVKVEANGDMLVEQTTSNAKVAFGGQEMDIPQETGTMKFKANGEILEINSPQPDESTNRREALNQVVLPDNAIKAGDKWTREFKASALNGNTSGKGEYKCIGVQKVGEEQAVAIKYTYTETSGATPASCMGTVWISPKDGSLIKGEMSYKNAPIPQMPPSDMTVKISKIG